MILKIVFGIVATFLLVAFVGPVILKLKDIALSAVLLIGLLMMLVDLWQSLRLND